MRNRTLLAAFLALALALPVFAGEQRVEVDAGSRPFRGVEGAPVTIYEFLDFQ